MDKIELSTEVLGRLTGRTQTEVVELLKSDESESGYLQGDDLVKKVENLVGEKFKSISEQQRGRAKREVLTDFEKQLRSTYNVDNRDLKGADLVDHLINSARSEKSELTPDAIKAHPFFREAMKSKNEELQTVTNQFTTYKADQKNRAVRGEVDRKAKGLLLALNPVLSKNETIKENQVKMFLSSLNGNFSVEGENIKVLGEDGNEVLDQNYNPVNFDSFVKNRASSFFDFHEVDPNKRSPQDRTKHSPNGNGSNFQFPNFANMGDAMKYLHSLKKEDTKKAMAFAKRINEFVKT